MLRVVALSGGYGRDEANARLARNPGVIASFSRALTEGLTAQQSDDEFDAALDTRRRQHLRRLEARCVAPRLRYFRPGGCQASRIRLRAASRSATSTKTGSWAEIFAEQGAGGGEVAGPLVQIGQGVPEPQMVGEDPLRSRRSLPQHLDGLLELPLVGQGPAATMRPSVTISAPGETARSSSHSCPPA